MMSPPSLAPPIARDMSPRSPRRASMLLPLASAILFVLDLATGRVHRAAPPPPPGFRVPRVPGADPGGVSTGVGNQHLILDNYGTHNDPGDPPVLVRHPA